MKKLAIRLTAVVLVSLMFFGMYRLEDPNKEKGLSKVNTNDLKDHIDINQIDMLFYNNGISSYNNAGSGSSGLYWPKGSGKTAIFEDGLLFAGRVGATEIRCGGSAYRAGLQAGPILADGTAADPSDPRYKIYKIKSNWESMPDGPEKTKLKSDYDNWPGDLGAPFIDVNNNGKWDAGIDKPQFLGDEVDFFVMNDLDAARTTFLYGTQPMGVEVATTIWGFNRTGDLGNMIFKKYRMINKGSITVRNMSVAQWSDPDLGDASDDYVGCDTVRSLGYVYNGAASDGVYGNPPPAVGYDFFQGPVIPYDPAKYPIITQKNLPDSAKFGGKWIKGKTNLPLSSFSFYINGSSTYKDPVQGVAAGSEQMYNYMTSKLWDGTPFLDPSRGNVPVNFCLYGDPVKGTGWYEGAGWPGGPAADDRRMMLSAGPFTFAPGDTQEVVVGIVVAKGSSNINSVEFLKNADDAAQKAYDLDFNLVAAPPSPVVKYAALDKKLVLYWEPNAEKYDAFDPLLGKKNFKNKDTSYKFQGYLVYQYKDASATDPVLLATYDIVDSISKVLDYQTYLGETVLVPVVNGANTGLRRTLEITIDQYTNGQLNNGTPYYFGVVAYGFCSNGSPKILASPHKVLLEAETVDGIRPQSISAGESYKYTADDFLITTAPASGSDGIVAAKVIDPNALTGHDYEVFMSGTGSSMKWNLRDITKGDTLLRSQPFDVINTAAYQADGIDFSLTADTSGAKIIDGFIIRVGNPSEVSQAIKEVVMVKDAGKTVEGTTYWDASRFVKRKGVNVFGASTATSTRPWWISSLSVGAMSLQTLNTDNNAGEYDYNIEFTDTANASQYYTFNDIIKTPSKANNRLKANPVGKNKIPVIGWNLKDPANPKRMTLKAPDSSSAVTRSLVTVPNGRFDSTWTSTVVNQQRLVSDSVAYEEIYFFQDTAAYPADGVLPAKCRLSVAGEYPLTRLTLFSKVKTDVPTPGVDLPKPGTVVKVVTWKTLKSTDVFKFNATKPKRSDVAVGKTTLNRISVYPNPYFGANTLEKNKYQRFVRFTNLPAMATIRISTLAGVFVQRIDKNSTSPFVDWNLLNADNIPVASGVFLAYVEIPDVGTKILKIAVVQETPYIDRL